MKNFCCRVCGCSDCEEIDLGNSVHFIPAKISDMLRTINRIWVCSGCTTTFLDPLKFSLTKKQQKERRRISADLDDVVERSVRGDFYKERHDVHKKDG